MVTPWKPFLKDACLAGLIAVAGLTLVRWGGAALPLPWPAASAGLAAVLLAGYLVAGPRPASSAALSVRSVAPAAPSGRLEIAAEPRAAVPADGGTSWLHRVRVANATGRPLRGVTVTLAAVPGRGAGWPPLNAAAPFPLAPGASLALGVVREEFSAGRGPRDHPHVFQSVERPAVFLEHADSAYGFILAASSPDLPAPVRARAVMTWNELKIAWELSLSPEQVT